MKTSDFEVWRDGEYVCVKSKDDGTESEIWVELCAGEFLLAWLEEQGEVEPDLGACEECAHLCRDFDDKPSCGVGLAWKYGVGYCAERQPKKAGPIKLTERTDAEKIEWLIGRVALLEASNRALGDDVDNLQLRLQQGQKPWRPTRRQGV